MTAFELQTTYLGLDGAGGVTKLPVGPDFWQTIHTNPAAGGTLVTVHDGEGAWGHWEMHPKGDEVLVILRGSVRMWLEHPDGRLERIDHKAGDTIVIPRGAWHWAEQQQDLKTLFITYGPGTTHRPLTDAQRARMAAFA